MLDEFESGLMRQHSERYRKSAERILKSQEQYLNDDQYRASRPPHDEVRKTSPMKWESKFKERNPYKEPDNMFYHESVENMMKSSFLNNFADRKGEGGRKEEKIRQTPTKEVNNRACFYAYIN